MYIFMYYTLGHLCSCLQNRIIYDITIIIIIAQLLCFIAFILKRLSPYHQFTHTLQYSIIILHSALLHLAQATVNETDCNLAIS